MIIHRQTLRRRLLTLTICIAVPIDLRASVRHVPADHPTIQAAITASVNGDVILVAPGVYFENVVFGGKLVTLASEAGPAVTTIDGGMLDTVVRFSNGETNAARLQGFTITHGRGSDPPISASPRGGGTTCSGSSPTITGNIFTANTGSWGGGVMSVAQAAPTISGNEFHHNSSVHFGGAIMVYEASARIEKNSIHDNTSGNAGGIYVAYGFGYSIDTWIVDNVIRGNAAAIGGGGGIAINAMDDSPPAVAHVLRNTIEANTALGSGGGMWITSSSPNVENNVLRGNTARSGGGIGMVSADAAFLRGNSIVGNIATDSGGGLLASFGSIASLHENTLADNRALVLGGGLCLSSSSLNVRGTILAHNSATEGAEAHQVSGSTLTLAYVNIGEGVSSIISKSGSAVTYAGPILATDPQFVAADLGDYRLRWRSPCIDAGNPAAAANVNDIFGVSRPVDGDLDTVETADIGAFEFAPLVLANKPQLSGSMILECWGDSGSTVDLWLAATIVVGGLNTPFGQYNLPVTYGSFWLRSDTDARAPVILTRAIGSHPGLIGQRISIQGLATSSSAPLGFAWTNPITFVIQP